MKKLFCCSNWLLILTLFCSLTIAQPVTAQVPPGNLEQIKCTLLYPGNDTTLLGACVAFSFGSGTICPHLSGYQIQYRQDTMDISLFYNVTGAWPAFFCSSCDTLSLGNLPDTINYLYVNTNMVLQISDTATDMDTTHTIPDTLIQLHPTGIVPISPLSGKIKVYPNPVYSYLQVEAEDGIKIRAIEIRDIQGRALKYIPGATKNTINCSNLAPGLYFLEVRTEKGKAVFKLLKE